MIDTRLSNTASMADYWLPPWPGTEAALLLAMRQLLIARAPLRPRVRAPLGQLGGVPARGAPGRAADLRDLRGARSRSSTRTYTPEFAERESRASRPRPSSRSRGEVGAARRARSPPTSGATPRRATSAAGRSRARCSSCIVLIGRGGHARAAPRPTPGTSSCPAPPHRCRRPRRSGTSCSMPRGVPARVLRDVLPPAALPEGGPRQARRVLHPRLQPGVDQPRRLHVDRDAAPTRRKIGLPRGLTPTWSETAWFADYVLPMGHASERHDLMCQETHAARWIGFRQPVLRVALRAAGQERSTTWQAHEAASLGRGVGGGRVLDRALVAHRSRRRRSASASTSSRPYRPGEKLTRRRVLRLDLRALGARPAGGRARRRA